MRDHLTEIVRNNFSNSFANILKAGLDCFGE
jgi:hypothetical protein